MNRSERGDLTMVISGLYLETVPGKAHTVAKELERKESVEVHHIEGDYKIVITIETETADESYKIADTFKEIDGILTTCLVYSHFEDDPFCQVADEFR